MTLQSHSQSGQDLFAFAMCEGKTNGYFVDIGCNDAQFHSNTYALEQIGWRGLLIDIVGGCENRKSTFIQCDAANPNDCLKFFYNHLPEVTDYLSLDVDENLLAVFDCIPWDKATFRVITLEHDSYRLGPKTRNATRAMLHNMGYELMCGDVMVIYPETEPPRPFEDWWCHPQFVNPDLIRKYKSNGKFWKEILGL